MLPKCIKCGELFEFIVGSIVYARYPDTEFQGICKDCNNKGD